MPSTWAGTLAAGRGMEPDGDYVLRSDQGDTQIMAPKAGVLSLHDIGLPYATTGYWGRGDRTDP